MGKEKRSLFQKVFGKKESVSFGQSLDVLNGLQNYFTPFAGNIYDTNIARSCIDAIARNGAKLSPKHIRKTNTKLTMLDEKISTLISKKPNEIMNAYDMYYKVITHLYLHNNAFIYIKRDSNKKPIGLYPVNAGSYSVVEYNDNLFFRFSYANGKIMTAIFDDVIHLKRFYCENDILGGNSTPLKETLDLLDTTKKGIANAIKITGGVLGILKTTQSMLKDEDIIKQRNQFLESFLSDENNKGIAGLDSKTDFEAIKLNPTTATDSQMQQIKDEVLEYFGVNDKILKSNYTEEEWNAFYESVLEPIALMLGLEFTNKLFNFNERAHGNQIVFEAQRLQYASNKTKIDVSRYLNNYMTVNEIREMFNMSPVEDGDKIMQDLNHISSEVADQYQLDNKKGEDTDED